MHNGVCAIDAQVTYMIPCVQDGETALYIVSEKGHGTVVKVLLQMEHTDVNISQKVHV